jgi:hypothetical protein
MTSQRHHDLIEALCRLAGIADAAAVHRQGSLRVGDVEFTLLPVAQAGGEMLVAYCDFGPPPAREREKALQRLLELNLLLYGGEGPAFSFNRESGHVLLMAQLRLEQATAEAVLTVLRSMTLFAQRWRGDHFLADEPRAPVGGVARRGSGARTPFANN